jgi:Putative DNA-binding domain
MPFEATIDSFARALVEPSRPAPAATRRSDGRSVERRFAVYRNNVAVALIGSLEARYPVVRRLVGDDFFRGMAGAYVAAEKPRSPTLIHYGDGFPDFVAGFPPAGAIPFLADVARLENAWVEAYHAAEAEVLALDGLAAIAPDALAGLRFRPHPAARLLRFSHPAASIWAGSQGGGEPRAPEIWLAEEALVARPDADVFVRVLPPGGFAFAAALFSGASLGEAATLAAIDGFDPGAHLVGLIEAGAFQSLISKEP